jgi:hypothetical protein
VERAEQTQPVEPRQEQIEDDEVVALRFGQAQTLLAVSRAQDCEAFGLEPTRNEIQDSRLIFDDENPQLLPAGATLTHFSPTWR